MGCVNACWLSGQKATKSNRGSGLVLVASSIKLFEASGLIFEVTILCISGVL